MNVLEYKTEEEANHSLQQIGNLIIVEDNVRYLAVVKNNHPSFQYKIEIGTSDGKEIEFIKVLEKNKNLKEVNDEIGGYLAHTGNINSIITTTKVKEFSIHERKASLKEEKNLSAGMPIGTKNSSSGTLGGIFFLEDFPDHLFGISNWHVLTEEVGLGGPITNGVGNSNKEAQIGTLFWESLDHDKEVAFVLFNKDYFKSISNTNACGYKLNGKICFPEIGMEVVTCGITSTKGYSSSREIYSSNSIIKINEGQYKSHNIFYNQILIKNLSNSGDSGSLISNKKGEVVGLIFAETKEIENTHLDNITVANNIQHIFNKTFSFPQRIEIENEYKYISQFNLNKFI
ncbi:hypothetical protein [Aquimarina megaterium]|uniref:hypothetical protein n=1 Tax=Aquimarina megaterium TaxID=1443666 RepID=UPI0009435136|nr:hypothetical protein [Aquimarina megaterium]